MPASTSCEKAPPLTELSYNQLYVNREIRRQLTHPNVLLALRRVLGRLFICGSNENKLHAKPLQVTTRAIDNLSRRQYANDEAIIVPSN